MNELSRDDIRHLSHLSRLELTEEEYARYATQLSSVVEYVAQLQDVDTSGVESHLGVTGKVNVLADDVQRDQVDPARINPLDVINAAPRHKGRLVEVRAVLGEEVGAA